MGVFGVLLGMVRALLLPRDALIAENLALRQQLAVLPRTAKRPRLRQRDRIFWVWLFPYQERSRKKWDQSTSKGRSTGPCAGMVSRKTVL